MITGNALSRVFLRSGLAVAFYSPQIRLLPFFLLSGCCRVYRLSTLVYALINLFSSSSVVFLSLLLIFPLRVQAIFPLRRPPRPLFLSFPESHFPSEPFHLPPGLAAITRQCFIRFLATPKNPESRYFPPSRTLHM